MTNEEIKSKAKEYKTKLLNIYKLMDLLMGKDMLTSQWDEIKKKLQDTHGDYKDAKDGIFVKGEFFRNKGVGATLYLSGIKDSLDPTVYQEIKALIVNYNALAEYLKHNGVHNNRDIFQEVMFEAMDIVSLSNTLPTESKTAAFDKETVLLQAKFIRNMKYLTPKLGEMWKEFFSGTTDNNVSVHQNQSNLTQPANNHDEPPAITSRPKGDLKALKEPAITTKPKNKQAAPTKKNFNDPTVKPMNRRGVRYKRF